MEIRESIISVKRLSAILVAFVAFAAPMVVFGDPLSDTTNDINSNFPSNATGSITAAKLRSVLVDFASRVLGPGNDNGTSSLKTAPYTIALGDCGTSVVASNGFYTITLPAASGFGSSCTIKIKNNDSIRAKALAGFPADLNTILYPQQTATIKIVNGAWITLDKPKRWRIPGATTVYVNPVSGNDSNDGLATGSGAFATLQKAWNTIVSDLDTNNYQVTIQAQDGTYTTGLKAGPQQPVGNGQVLLQGNVATPTNVVIAPSVANSIGIQVFGQAWLNVSGIYCNSANLLACFYTDAGGGIGIVGNMTFGQSAIHMQNSHGFIFVNSNYTIAGGASYHMFVAYSGSQIEYGSGVTATLTGTPAFTFFAYAYGGGSITALNGAAVFSGAATGVRYVASLNGVIDTSGGGANFFPGNSAGAALAGGQYN